MGPEAQPASGNFTGGPDVGQKSDLTTPRFETNDSEARPATSGHPA